MEKKKLLEQFNSLSDKELFALYNDIDRKLSDMMKVNIEELFEEKEVLETVMKSRGYVKYGEIN